MPLYSWTKARAWGNPPLTDPRLTCISKSPEHTFEVSIYILDTNLQFRITCRLQNLMQLQSTSFFLWTFLHGLFTAFINVFHKCLFMLKMSRFLWTQNAGPLRVHKKRCNCNDFDQKCFLVLLQYVKLPFIEKSVSWQNSIGFI